MPVELIPYEVIHLSDTEIAAREQGLCKLEATLLAKPYATVQEREQVLGQFYDLAGRLRNVHHEVSKRRLRRLN